MNKIVFLVLVGILSLSVTSCSRKVDDNANKPSSIKVEAGANQSPDDTEAEKAEAEAAKAEKGAENEGAQIIAGLTPATNPDLRVKGIARGRTDPFSVLTVKPRIEVKEEKEVNNNQSDRANRRDRRTNRDRQVADSRRGSDSRGSARNQASATQPFRAALAQDVIISGLIDVNGRPKLIVNAPEEATSRYVEVGQYLSNGQILVKSIDLNYFPTPLVILEQSGIEVAKTIGEASDIESVSSLPPEIPSSAATWLSDVSLSASSNQ